MKTIEETIEQYACQIHDQNEKKFRKLFRTDVILISGTKVFEGIDEIWGSFLAELIHQKYSDIRLVKEDLKINRLDERTAVAVFRYHTECTLRENGLPHGISGVETQVLQKQAGSWQIVHIHYTSK